MKSLLKILYLLVALLILSLLAGLLLPRSGSAESEIVIYASPELVFDQVNDLKKWEKWSPWFETDSTMMFSYIGPPSGHGAVYEWTSDHSGKGRMSITKSEPFNRVEALIDFGVQGKLTTRFQFIPLDSRKTKLVWALDYTDVGYLERYLMILFKKNIQSTFNSGLKNIREISEQLRLDRISEVKIVETQLQHSLGIIDSSSQEEILARIAEGYKKLSAYLLRRNISPAGKPFVLYFNRNSQGDAKYACCIPIPERTWGWKEYTYIELPQGQAATLTHWGKYGTGTPYLAMSKYLEGKKLNRGSYCWEVYLNDPATEPDTSKWEMQFFCPIQ